MNNLPIAHSVLAAAILAPALVFAAMASFLGDAPAEWAEGALLSWSALAVCLFSGLALAGGTVLWPTCGIVLAFVALMVGGPPGLIVACLAAIAVAIPGDVAHLPRWLPIALAAMLAGVGAVRFVPHF